jgi:hypothetical protein
MHHMTSKRHSLLLLYRASRDQAIKQARNAVIEDGAGWHVVMSYDKAAAVVMRNASCRMEPSSSDDIEHDEKPACQFGKLA